VKKDALRLGHSGSAVSGVLRSADRAELTISTILHNSHGIARRGMLCCTLLDPAGRALAQIGSGFHIFGRDRNLQQFKLTVDDASWLVENPGKYLIRTRIVCNDTIVDEEISPFDFRAALTDDPRDEFLSRMS
jgi:hypothetical protein